jgi:hypothetical protein
MSWSTSMTEGRCVSSFAFYAATASSSQWYLLLKGGKTTYENDSIRTWKARKVHFGGGTHIRYYGRDFRDRLKSAGFDVSEFCATPEQAARYSLIRGERVFISTKP